MSVFLRHTHQSPRCTPPFVGVRHARGRAEAKRFVTSPAAPPAAEKLLGREESVHTNHRLGKPRRCSRAPLRRGLRGSLPKEPRPQSIHGCGPLSPMGACPLQGARRAPIVCSRPEASSAPAEPASSCVVVRSRVLPDRRANSRRSYCPFVTSHRPVRAFVSQKARHHPFACERLDDCLAALSRTFRSCPTCSPLPDSGLSHLADRHTFVCARHRGTTRGNRSPSRISLKC